MTIRSSSADMSTSPSDGFRAPAGRALAVVILLLATGVPARAAASVQPVRLRCEYRVNPTGVDVARPRLGWALEAAKPTDRGQRQSGYQILVASRPEWLRPGKADLWDSGLVRSGQSTLIDYAGAPLRNGMKCWWTVQARDETGARSDWAKPAQWSMGPMGAADWTADWIGTDQVFVKGKGWPPPDNTIPDPWLRKAFTLDRVPERAVASVASVGYHELFVNGRKAGEGILMPNATDHRVRARYTTYDVTNLLRPGTNVLGLWLGLSWSIFPHYQTPDKPAAPLVRAQVDLSFAGGTTTRWVTDGTWKTHPSPNTLLGVWDFMFFGGECFDSNRDEPGWAEARLDDSGWGPVKVFRPNLVVSADLAEPNRPIAELKPVRIEPVGVDTYRVDFGANFAGWVEARLQGAPGQRVELLFSERAATNLTQQMHSALVLGPDGKGTFRNRFNYGVGRWLTIRGVTVAPEPEAIRGWLVRSEYEPAARFECSNPLFNRIHATALWTLENLSVGGYLVDCPHRERMGYGGDAHATVDTALDNYLFGAVYTKWSQDWRDVQAGDGQLPYTAPTYWGGGGPVWSGWVVTLPWETYVRYGDRRLLEENYATMERWLAFLETKAQDHLLRRWGGEWDFLGDWLWPGAKGVNGDTRETLFFNNCFWIYALDRASRIAGVLGREPAARAFRERADQVRQAVHREFYQPDAETYVNSHMAYLAMALFVDLPPAALRPIIWRRLEYEIRTRRQGHIHAGITGGAFLFKSLLAAERNDLLLEMVRQTTYPGWGDQLQRGATTFWESWEDNPELSYLHSSYLYVGYWFNEALGGIRPDPEHPGYAHFQLRPFVPEDRSVTWVRASHDTLRGTIRSAWRIEGNRFHYEVTVPPNTSALSHIPAARASGVLESGKPLRTAPGITWQRDEPDAVVVRLEPGTYHFTSDWRGVR